MFTPEGTPVGGLSDVGELGDEWNFTLYDAQRREVVAFAYHDEATARRSHKAIQMTISDAVALPPAFEQFDLFAMVARGRS